MRPSQSSLISLAHLTVLNASPPELIALAHGAGCDLVGLRLIPVTAEERPWPVPSDKALLAETRRSLSETGIGVLDVELVRLTPDLVVANLESFLATAAELSAKRVLTQVHDADLARAGQRYGELCDLAHQYGLTCDIEFLPWAPVNDVRTAVTFVGGVGRPNSGLCIDALHFARSLCTPSEIGDIPADWLHFAQICDAPAEAPRTTQGLIAAAREHRLLPGEGAIPLVEIIYRLPPGTPLSLEIPNVELGRVLSPQERVRRAVEATRRVLDEVELRRKGGEWSGSADARGSDRRKDIPSGGAAA